MRFFKKIAILMLVPIVLSGCNCGKNEDTKTEVLYGFESVKELLTVYRVNVSKTELCKDKNYVSEGDASMKIVCDSPADENTFAADTVVAFTPENKFFNKKDYSYSGNFSIDIFNPNQAEYEMCINVGDVTNDFYVLKSGLNTIETENYSTNLEFFEITFRGQKGKGHEFYIDNFRYNSSDEKISQYAFDNKKQNFIDFENGYEKTLFELNALAKPESVFSTPRFSVTADKNYIKTGNSALCVQFGKTKDGNYDITSFKTKNGFVADISLYKNGGYFFVSEIYNDFDKDVYVEIVFNAASGETYGKRLKMSAKSWTDTADAKIYIDEITGKISGTIVSIGYNFSGISGEGCVYIDALKIEK